MPYKDHLDNESAPARKKLLPQGWRHFKFTFGEEATSKAGNPMFKLQIEDQETKYQEDIYIVRTPGKRWILKQILEAIGINKDAEGSYTYELNDLIGIDIMGEVEHSPNEYINRSGDTVKTTQHKIINFKKFSANPGGVDSPDKIAWDE